MEVVGDGPSISKTTRRAYEYLTSGAKMVWIVNADPERLALFMPPEHVRILVPDDTLEGGHVLPGFRCSVAEMFA